MEVIYAVYFISIIICLLSIFVPIISNLGIKPKQVKYNLESFTLLITWLFISFFPPINTLFALGIIKDFFEKPKQMRKFHEDTAKIREFIKNNQAVSAKKIFEGLHLPSGTLQSEYLFIKDEVDQAMARLEETNKIEMIKRSEKIRRIDEEEKKQREQQEEKEKEIIQRSALLVQAGRTIDSLLAQAGQILDSLSSKEFELIILEAFSRQGYVVTHTPFSGDEGIDGFLEKGGLKIAIQCKKHSGSIGQPAIRDFYGAMMHFKCDEGFFITTSDFSDPARDFVENKKIKLFDRQKTLNLLQSTLNNGYVLNGKQIRFPYPFEKKESILSTLEKSQKVLPKQIKPQKDSGIQKEKAEDQGKDSTNRDEAGLYKAYLIGGIKAEPLYICKKCGKEIWTLDKVIKSGDRIYCQGCGSWF